VRVLADHGIKTIVLAADHGHLFADEIGEDMKIDAPGGKVEDLHRRVWVGVGGTSEPSYLRTSLASLGVDSEFDIATPWTFAVFKAKGGARAYFHGGGSQPSLFGIEPPKVRIELRADKKCVSLPVSASYGFEDATGEVTLKIAENDNNRIEPNTVTVMLAEEISQKTIGVHLLDATTGAELAAPLMVDVAISM
jgi:hypothetical protein